MDYGIKDWLIGRINLLDYRNEGCDSEGTKIRVEVKEKYIKLFVGPRDWQWNRETGEMIGCGTSLPSEVADIG